MTADFVDIETGSLLASQTGQSSSSKPHPDKRRTRIPGPPTHPAVVSEPTDKPQHQNTQHPAPKRPTNVSQSPTPLADSFPRFSAPRWLHSATPLQWPVGSPACYNGQRQTGGIASLTRVYHQPRREYKTRLPRPPTSDHSPLHRSPSWRRSEPGSRYRRATRGLGQRAA